MFPDSRRADELSVGGSPAGHGLFGVVLLYVAAASAWILFSDNVLALHAGDREQMVAIGIFKGFLFVGVSALLLAYLLKRMLDRLAEREAALRSITEYAGDAIVVFDPGLRIVYANPAASQLTGYGTGELRSLVAGDLITEEARAALPAHLERLAHQDYSRDEWLVLRKDGGQRIAEVTTQRLPDGRYLAIGRDVTAACQAQKALKESEKRFRTLFESASDGVFVTDGDGRFLNVNQCACDSLGYSRSELLSMGVSDVEIDYDPAGLREVWRTVFEGDSITVSGRHCRADGTTFPVEVRISAYSVDGQHYLLALARDITERQQALEALRASEEFSRAVLDSSSSLIAVLDRNGRIVAVNESWRRFARERTESPVQLSGTGVDVNFLDVCLGSVGRFSEQATAAYHGVLDVLEGNIDRFRLDCPCISTRERLWFLMNVTPLRSGGGGAVVAYLDITDWKQAQEMREHAAAQLKALAKKHLAIQEEERRMLSLELHDHVGQTLTGLKLTLDAMRHKAAALPPAQLLLASSIEIVDGLVETIRDISRRLRPPMLDDLGLASAVRWHTSKLATPSGLDVRLHENLDEERFAPEIELASFRIIQEAVSNAMRHAHANHIEVTLSRRPNSLCLTVRDDGIGFDVEENFKNSENLASLGLIGMRERVAGLNGHFRLESAPGAGTELVVSFFVPSPS